MSLLISLTRRNIRKIAGKIRPLMSLLTSFKPVKITTNQIVGHLK